MIIKNARVLDPASGRDETADILLEGGRIAAIGSVGGTDVTVDGRGLVAAPGLVDIHVHFRDPGMTYKEDLESGAAAALRGGFTSVVCMANTKPAADCPQALADILGRAGKLPVRVYQAAAVTAGLGGAVLCDFESLRRAGAAGFSDDGVPLTDAAQCYAAMCAARRLDAPLSLHEEDPAFVWDAGVNEGAAAQKLGLRGASHLAEDALVARDCMLALSSGAKVHFQHLSSGNAVDMVRFARKMGARVTAEATPHHFTLCEEDVARFGSNAKVNPPLRTENDRRRIIEGLRDGTISIIATDHAPHARDEKARPFAQAPSGIIGLETSLALGLTELVHTGRLTLMQLLEKMTVHPARLYGLDAGELREGGRADIVLFDPDEEWKPDVFASKSQNSPFIGRALRGRVRYTVADGRLYAAGPGGMTQI